MEIFARKKPNPVRLGLLLFLLALLGSFYWGQRSQRLAVALVQAVVEHNARRAHDLLERGADPNARLAGLGIGQESLPVWERLLKLFRAFFSPEPPRGRSVLYQAVVGNEPQIVRDLVKHGANVNARFRGAEPLIVRALTPGNPEIIRALLDAGANLSEKSRDGQSLLMRASALAPAGTVALFLDRGANVNETDAQSRTPLRAAAEMRNVPVISLLLSRGARAADIGKAGVMMRAYRLGVPSPSSILAPPGVLRSAAPRPVPPILIAAQSASPELIRAVWKAGESRHRTDSIGVTALSMAVMGGPPESVRTLLDLGVPLSGTSVGPVSILNTAVSSGSLEMVHLLLDRGVPVNAADRSGRTPLHVAAMGQNAEIVRELLRRGASVNARDTHSGAAPLHQAMSLEVAKLLLARPDIEIDARDQKGKTPLMLCRNDPVARLLIERGANIHARDNQGATVLMNAVQQRSLELSRLLLQRGANPLTPDSTGQTPLDEANRSNFPILRDLLQKYSGAKPAKTLPPRELNALPPAPH